MKNNNTYISPAIEVIALVSADVITLSGQGGEEVIELNEHLVAEWE